MGRDHRVGRCSVRGRLLVSPAGQRQARIRAPIGRASAGGDDCQRHRQPRRRRGPCSASAGSSRRSASGGGAGSARGARAAVFGFVAWPRRCGAGGSRAPYHGGRAGIATERQRCDCAGGAADGRCAAFALGQRALRAAATRAGARHRASEGGARGRLHGHCAKARSTRFVGRQLAVARRRHCRHRSAGIVTGARGFAGAAVAIELVAAPVACIARRARRVSRSDSHSSC